MKTLLMNILISRISFSFVTSFLPSFLPFVFRSFEAAFIIKTAHKRVGPLYTARLALSTPSSASLRCLCRAV